jgi:hypothetical protein
LQREVDQVSDGLPSSMHFLTSDKHAKHTSAARYLGTQNLRVSILISYTKGEDENVSTALNEEEIEEAAPKIGLTS